MFRVEAKSLPAGHRMSPTLAVLAVLKVVGAVLGILLTLELIAWWLG